jgi:alpha-N-acetylglucosamine transferase
LGSYPKFNGMDMVAQSYLLMPLFEINAIAYPFSINHVPRYKGMLVLDEKVPVLEHSHS